MTAGLATVALANAMLNGLSNTSFALAAMYAQMHTADPGAAGTTSASGQTGSRPAMTWAAASGGSKALTTTLPTWTLNVAGPETETFMSAWSAATAGTFYYSWAVTSKTLSLNDVLNLTAHSMSLAPLAA